ncbi:MAG: DUF4838 domain-containing protein [Armatimonadetes bacterium]|nr:DUF4838 domain-containing protein [Armatimonadota bacterium]
MMNGSILWLTALGVTAVAASEAAPFPVAASGQAKCVIVRAADAPPAEKRAADELADYLGRITGASFEVATADPGKKPAIVVGKAGMTRAAVPEKLEVEEFIIRTRGPRLFLAGGSPRGTLYAAYHFLDNILGVRWWTPTFTHVPRKANLSVGPLEVRERPVFEYRDPYLATAWNAEWAAHNRCNGPVGDQTGPKGAAGEEYGGSFLHYAGPMCHTFDTFVPASLLEKHPDWFSEVNGKRVAGQYGGQLCLSNPEVLDYMVQAVDALLQKNPGAANVSLTQNDNVNYCRCEKCRKVDEEEGSPSGLMVRFVNAVVERLEKKYPKVMFDTFAYQYTRKAPRLARPKSNVIIRLCSIECDFGRPLTAPTNKAFAEDAAAWAAIAHKMYVWDYITNFTNYFKPHPNLHVLGPNLRFFAANKVRGVFEQGTEATPTGEFEDLRAWVLSRLLWNPDRDDRKLIAEFCDGCYGPARASIQEYIRLMHDAQASSDYYLGCFAQDPAPFLNAESMSRADALFQSALKSVAGQPHYEANVRRAYLPVQSQWLLHYDEWVKEAAAKGLLAPASAPRILREFRQIVESLKITLFVYNSPTSKFIEEMEKKYGKEE